MHSEWLWVAGGLWHVPFLLFQPAKWWKKQFGPGVRDIIKEKGCLQLLHLTGNCQLTLTKKGISALAAAFKGSVIRWHYKYRIVHGGGGVGTSGSWTWQFCFLCALSKACMGLSKTKSAAYPFGIHTFCKRVKFYLWMFALQILETAASCSLQVQFQEWNNWLCTTYENYANNLINILYIVECVVYRMYTMMFT